MNLFDDFKPHPGQWAFKQSRARFRNIVAGRRWGKDYVGAREFIRKTLVEEYPKIKHLKPPSAKYSKYTKPLIHLWAVAPDYNIGKVQQREIFSIFPSEFQENPVNFSYDDNKKELRLLNNRILIEFKSADRPDSLVGVGLNGVYATEFARFKENAWSANIRSTLTDKQGWFIATTTPLPRQWFLDFVALGDPKSPSYHPAHSNFFGKTLDNIRIPNIAEEVDLARKTMPEKIFRREYEASLDFFEGQVYDEWSANTHCPRPFKHPRFDLVVAGVDWGYADPGCILVFGVVNTKEGRPRFYLVDEVFEAGVLVDGDGDTWVERASFLRDKWNISIFYCDTANPANIQTFRNNGLNAVFADKDISYGIQSVATAMHVSEVTGLPYLYVDAEAAPNWCREVVPYEWEKDETPVDKNNHTLDAGRYAIHGYTKYGGSTQYLTTGQEAPRRA